MGTSTATLPPGITALPVKASAITTYLVPLGRVFFSAIFIVSAAFHFSPAAIDYATSKGVPLANLAVPFAGVLAFLGGVSILLGYHARIGAALLIAFLVPVTLMMHNFWALEDPQEAMVQQAMFMKNLAMLGGVLLIAHFGPGPISFDARRDTHTT